MLTCMWGSDHSYAADGSVKVVQPLWKIFMDYFETKDVTPAWLNNYKPGYLSQRNENYAHAKTCTWVCIAAFFIIAKNWKQPKYLSMGIWLSCGTDILQNTPHSLLSILSLFWNCPFLIKLPLVKPWTTLADYLYEIQLGKTNEDFVGNRSKDKTLF